MGKINSYYAREINRIPLLSREEEKALAEKALNGDSAARKKLVESNLRFVVKIASRYSGYMDMDDLVNEGNLGLMKAAEKYNPANGAKFSTYASWWIKAYIQKAIRETSTGIRFPSTKFEEMKKSKWNIASLDKAIAGIDDDTTTLGAIIKDDINETPEDAYIKNEWLNCLSNSMDNLKDKEKSVLVKRFGLDGKEPCSLSEAGNYFGCSKERVRQIEKKALSELQRIITESYELCCEDLAA